jgi:hypothetical protein
MPLATVQLVACLLVVQLTCATFLSTSLFLITMHIMTVEAAKFNLFFSLCIFYFLLYSHSKMTTAQLVSQHVITKIIIIINIIVAIRRRKRTTTT